MTLRKIRHVRFTLFTVDGCNAIYFTSRTHHSLSSVAFVRHFDPPLWLNLNLMALNVFAKTLDSINFQWLSEVNWNAKRGVSKTAQLPKSLAQAYSCQVDLSHFIISRLDKMTFIVPTAIRDFLPIMNVPLNGKKKPLFGRKICWT